jgi:hypothetical protein
MTGCSSIKITNQPNKAEKPNIVLVITDDQGYGDVALHGNPIIQTLNIDKLGQESIRLTDYHVSPTCSPTRAALLTGNWSNRTGVWHTIKGRALLRTQEVTLAELLKKNGYDTALFGKWYLGDNYPYRPMDQGFDLAFYHGGGGLGQTPILMGLVIVTALLNLLRGMLPMLFLTKQLNILTWQKIRANHFLPILVPMRLMALCMRRNATQTYIKIMT